MINEDTKQYDGWKARITSCKRRRQELVQTWAESVDFLRGKPFETDSDEDRIAVNLDWSKTKAKHANLFSQVPQVILTAKQDKYASAAAPFAKALNDELTRAKAGNAVDDAVVDCINAAGVGVVVVAYERLTDEVDVPTVDLATLPPNMATELLASGKIPTQKVTRTTSDQFTVRRISPADLLWPVDFTGSDFDDGNWIGRTGRVSWAEAKNQFGLTDDVKDRVVGAHNRTSVDQIHDNGDGSQSDDTASVEFDEIYYWNHRYDANEKYFKAIYRLVFITGLENPVIHEPWNGQSFHEETGTYVGSCKFPIQVLTLARVPDDCIPPSDSAIARPQVLELIKSRSQLILQRDRSLPLRWFDVNRVDPLVQDNLMRGTWQGMIPTQGNGTNVIGEIARASYPREDMEFDRIAKSDIDEVWQSSANQAGSFSRGETSAAEAKIVQGNFQTRIGYERAKVAEFFLDIAEVLAGLMALYSNFPTLSDEERQALEQAWDRSTISQEFVYTVRVDSTVMLDANQRIERLMNVINMLGRSGVVDLTPLAQEVVSLSGLDPAKVIKAPTPPPQEPTNISLRLSGAEDLSNPIVVALLMKAGQFPSPDELEAAKTALAAAQAPAQTPAAPQPEQPQIPSPPPIENPDFVAMPKVVKRSVDR